ncbi:MAG: alkaline phosphatase D family protein [Flavobacteriales bacterium]|nr:alkaline phosphatase D family protein [Flavobacteriales bacterium]
MKHVFLVLSGTYCLLNFATNNHTFSNDVLYFWSGAVTHRSARVNIVLEQSAEKVRIACAPSMAFENPVYSSFQAVTEATGFAAGFDIIGLAPNTRYYYAVEINGQLDLTPDDIGSFQTFQEGAFSFSFLLGACNLFPNNPVYDYMRAQHALFYLNVGDLHYANPNSASVIPHREAYEDRVLSRDREMKLLRHTPIAYVWDDHDFCGDNNDGNNGCGPAAKQAYKEYVPHYPLGDADGPTGIYQAFTVGRVRFIMSDMRSERKDGHIFSEKQREWLKNEMRQAQQNGQIIAWVTSVSYSGTGKDNWGGFPADREDIGNFLRDENIQNMFILSGDAHMSAIDNGTHSDFSKERNNPNRYPIFQSAALNNVGSDKGGEYSEGGTFPNPPFTGQFGVVTVTDHGGSDICINFKTYRLNLIFDQLIELLNFDFCRTLPEVPITEASNTTWLKQVAPRHFEIRLPESGDLDLKVFDWLGTTYVKRYTKEAGELTALDLSALASGTYFVKVESNQRLMLQKIVLE